MPKYNVIVTRDATVSTVVDVTARGRQHALDKAIAEAVDFPQRFDWALDDGSLDTPYLGDESLTAAVRIK